MALYEKTGIVEEVLDAQTFSSGFVKRDIIVGNDVGSNAKYPNPVKFSFKKDNAQLLDGIRKGQRVTVKFAVDGRRWDGPKGTQYFVDLTGVKIALANEQETDVPPPAEPPFPGRPSSRR